MKNYLNSEIIKDQLSNLNQIVFEVTDACNLKCKYCAYGELYEGYDNRENKMLPVLKATKILDYLLPIWKSTKNKSALKFIYISFYGGEPLLNMPFIETVVNYVKNNLQCNNINFVFSMTTNALLLHRYIQFLKENDFRLLISLDGNIDNNSYRVNHAGKSVFNNIEENIYDMIQKHPEYFKKSVNFNSVIHNKNSVADVYDFFKRKYNKIPRLSELSNVGIKQDKKQEFMLTYKNIQENLHQTENYEKIEQDMFLKNGSYQDLALFLNEYSNFSFSDYKELLFGKNQKITLIPTSTCIPFSRRMFITVNGKILPCEHIEQQYTLGEITDDGHINLDFEMIARKYNSYLYKFEKQCHTCRNKRTCKQCMFYISNLKTKPICEGYMNEDKFNKYVNAQMNFLEKHPEDYKKIMEEVLIF